MWVFLANRLRLWLILAVVVPIAARVLGFVGDRIEARTGPTTVTRALKGARNFLGRRSRGPFAGRLAGTAGTAGTDSPR
jgi:hypothetical protein